MLITAADLSSLTALNPVNNEGTAFIPSTAADVQARLDTASKAASKSNTNESYPPSAQPAVMGLNILAGFVKRTDPAYAGGLLPYATKYGITGLTAGGFISVGNLMAAANAELALDPSAWSGDADRPYQAALYAAPLAANNNRQSSSTTAGRQPSACVTITQGHRERSHFEASARGSLCPSWSCRRALQTS